MISKLKRIVFRFLVIWAVFLVLGFIFVVIAGAISIPNYLSGREHILITSYRNAIVAANQQSSKEQTIEMLCQLKNTRELNFYLVAEDGEILSCTPPSSFMRRLVHKGFANKTTEPTKHQNIIVSSVLEDNKGQKYIVMTPGGFDIDNQYRIGRFMLHAFYFSPVAVLILLIFSYMFSRPLLKIQRALKLFSEGQFSDRLEKDAKGVIAELAFLRREFNLMAEKVESLINSKKTLLENVSHELRSPLARQQMALDLLVKGSEENKEKNIARIQLEIDKLNELIAEILEFSKLNSTIKSLNKTEIDLKSLGQAVIQDVNFEANSDCVQLKVIDHIKYFGDEYLLRRCIENLLRNAVFYAGTTNPIILAIEKSEQLIFIRVLDEGPGVSAKSIDYLFQPFFRANNKDKKIKGYGLGLAICQEIILLHDGKIKAKNRTPTGLEIIISLPI